MGRARLLTGIAVAAIAAAVHARSLSAGFVYDDHRFVVLNRALERPDPVAYLVDPATASAGTGTGETGEGIQADVFRPLRTLSFSLDLALFGREPLPWHAENVLLHGLNAWLAFLLLLPMVRGSSLAAAAGALVLAVHPVGVEAVAWVSARGDLLAVTFLLLALLVARRAGHGRTALAVALCALACLSKESAVVLPALLLLRDRALPEADRPPGRVTAVRVGLTSAVVLLYFAYRLHVMPGLAQVEHPEGGVAASVRGMLAALAWYGRALLVPSGFAFETDLLAPHRWTDPQVVLGLGILATVLAAGAWGWRRSPLLAFAALGFLACLVPVSNVLVPLKTFAAERFLYPALPCLGAAVAAGVVALRGRAVVAAGVGLAVALAVLAVTTWHRAAAWHDDESLWDAVRRDRPSNARAYEGLGQARLRAGRVEDASVAYRTYLEANPFDGKARRMLGDGFGRWADVLRSDAPPDPDTVTNVRERRQQARAAQVQLYREAVAVWDRFGFERGRGSIKWLRDTLVRAIDAAGDLGDLATAKAANDRLLTLDGVDPRDARAVAANGAFDRRLARVQFAHVALATPSTGLASAAYAKRQADRAAVLADVGLDPSRPDADLLLPLASIAAALDRERPGDVRAGLLTVETLLLRGAKDEAKRLLLDLEARFPDHPHVRALRRAVPR